MRQLRQFSIFALALILFNYFTTASSLALSDDELLDLIQKKSFNFFWNEANPKNGLVRDKVLNFKAGGDRIASIASVGFALTAYPIGVEHKWITRQQAYDRTLTTLKFFKDDIDQVHGFFYHFVNMEDGKRAWSSEVSSIDTALFLAGALFAGSYFKGTEVEQIANEIYERVDFPWMLNGGNTLSMGWKPETKFLKPRWDSYNESMILYILAIGSPTHPISVKSWGANRRKVMSYGSNVLIACPPLFTHQYSHCWVDFRDITDGFANYFKNSISATLANRQFCLDNRNKYKTYSKNVWGLTASDGPNGYKAYGSEPGGAVHDGTVAPTAAISSIIFTPKLSKDVVRELYGKHRELLWGRYGFTDAFNFDLNWKSSYVIGIDVGPMLLMIENYRTGFVWKYFMEIESVQRAMSEIGFRPGDKKLVLPSVPQTYAMKSQKYLRIDGNLSDWRDVAVVYMSPRKFIEYGDIDGPKDLSGEFSFQWDENYLYFFLQVHDDQITIYRNNGDIHRDDLVEIFVNPEGDGFRWKNKKNFQFGFSPSKDLKQLRVWLWPHGYDPIKKGNMMGVTVRKFDGYLVEAAIPWKLLQIKPHEGMILRITPMIHDLDLHGSEAKITWHFIQKGNDGYELGKVILQ